MFVAVVNSVNEHIMYCCYCYLFSFFPVSYFANSFHASFKTSKHVTFLYQFFSWIRKGTIQKEHRG